jgi:hypothetical protein
VLIVLQQLGMVLQLGQLLHKRPFPLHVAVASKYEQLDGRPFCVRPDIQRARLCFQRADIPQVGIGVVDSVFQLPERSIVIVQTDSATDLDADM